MPPEYADDQQLLKAAIDHALHARHDAAMAELHQITAKGEDRTYRLWQTLAESAIWPIRHQPPGGPRWGLTVFEKWQGVQDTPVVVELAVRFVTAQAGRNREELTSLFRKAQAEGTAVMEEALRLLLDAAAECARAQQARGTFGSGR